MGEVDSEESYSTDVPQKGGEAPLPVRNLSSTSTSSTLSLSQYSLPGTLHFLQTEWRRFERERNEWDIEKADMKVKMKLMDGNYQGTFSFDFSPFNVKKG